MRELSEASRNFAVRNHRSSCVFDFLVNWICIQLQIICCNSSDGFFQVRAGDSRENYGRKRLQLYLPPTKSVPKKEAKASIPVFQWYMSKVRKRYSSTLHVTLTEVSSETTNSIHRPVHPFQPVCRPVVRSEFLFSSL